ncbi:hypothetical protein CLAIMM_12758 [Cladophialophora immunda]|nr:hypothetical protein CLAIMM_12758 [Cladophialophora immunda]
MVDELKIQLNAGRGHSRRIGSGQTCLVGLSPGDLLARPGGMFRDITEDNEQHTPPPLNEAKGVPGWIGDHLPSPSSPRKVYPALDGPGSSVVDDTTACYRSTFPQLSRPGSSFSTEEKLDDAAKGTWN